MNYIKNDGKGNVEGYFIIASCETKTSSKGAAYLDLMLCDNSGDISAKFWDYNKALHGTFEKNTLVKVRASLSQYNGADQLRIDRIRHTSDADNLKLEDYVPSAEYGGEIMFDEIYRIADSFVDTDLKNIVLSILSENKDRILYWPAAFKLHHALRGGLLYHTLSILRLAEAVCKIYDLVDKELLFSGVMLHDVAKIFELDAAETGIANEYSVDGNLLGHLAMGAILIDRAAKKVSASEETATLLKHMVLSHHGDPMYGAAVRPMFIEAELLSELDSMDATVYEMSKTIFETPPNEFSGRQWALDNRRLYNHARTSPEPKAKLF